MLRVSSDGKYLDPPGDGRPYLAALEDGGGPLPGGLYVVGEAEDPGRAIAAARRAGAALVAAPASADRGFGHGPADILLEPLPADPAAAAAAALAAGLRAGARPLLVDVSDPETEPDTIVAALDVGAAGALVRGGRAKLIAQAQALEADRLDAAPMMSVVVCNYNGARYLDRCLGSLARLRYPRYEVIVCDDGSTDDSVAVARRHEVRLLELGRVGLSAARNAGAQAATGDVVVYLDGDTEADPHVLARTWRLLDRLGADGTGGPNLPFADAGWEERAVSGAPGGSLPVVHADGTAVLLAGCNMAFRKEALEAVGGFDERFPGAFDDVVLCLRMSDSGRRLVYHPTASILHHRRDSIAGFLRQQHAWGAGVTHFEELGPRPRDERRQVVETKRGAAMLRLDRDRMSAVFSGPQAAQRFILAESPLHVGLPAKALAALAVLAAGGALPAWRVGLLRRWALLCGAALGALFAVVASRVPVFGAPRGPAGAGLRAATAALWFAQPFARRLGLKRGSRLRS